MIEWNEYWRKYSTSKAEKWLILERDRLINACLDKLRGSRKRIIEVGCGYGTNSRLIQESRNDVECHALDNSHTAIKLLRKDIPDVSVADCQRAPFFDKSFDLIFSAGLMEHFKDEKPFLREMRRTLKDNGLLITFVPAKYSLWQAYKLIHFGKWQHGYEKAYSYEALGAVMIQNGFHVIEMIGIDPFSLNGFAMKLLDTTFPPFVRKSFSKSAYTELCAIVKKAD
jgi:SAM-dependent methyltransferase